LESLKLSVSNFKTEETLKIFLVGKDGVYRSFLYSRVSFGRYSQTGRRTGSETKEGPKAKIGRTKNNFFCKETPKSFGCSPMSRKEENLLPRP
jgi:hypothetical protein